MRIYLASDFHAAEKAWRKFLNAIKLNVYKADVALVAGDLTGKAIVPIVRRGGAYEAELFGVRRRAGSDDELAVLQRDIADVGFYSFISTAEEAERLATDPEARGELLHDLMNERVSEWLDLADERLGGGAVPLYLIPGNDDDFAIDPILNREGAFAQNVDGRVARRPRRPPAARVRVVEHHAVGHASRGARGGPRGPARGAGDPGARPAPLDLHDPRPAARLGPRHRTDPR